MRQSKPVEHIFDLTLVLADMSEKALAQVKRGAVELLTPRLDQASAEKLAEKLAGGHWTHDYALTAHEAAELGSAGHRRHAQRGSGTDEALPAARAKVGRGFLAHRRASEADDGNVRRAAPRRARMPNAVMPSP